MAKTKKRSKRYWWQEPKQARPNAIWQAAEKLYDATDSLRGDYLAWLSTYTNRAVYSFHGIDFIEGTANPRRIRMNVIRSAIDTLVATLAVSTSRPQAITVAGNTTLRDQAKKLNKFIMGLFFSLKHYIIYQKVKTIALICGDCYQLVTDRDDEVYTECVPPWEVLVHPSEENPLQFMRFKTMTQAAALDLFPGVDEKLFVGAEVLDSEYQPEDDIDQLVTVIEAWKIKSSKKGKGQYEVITSQGTVHSTEWNDPLPLARDTWSLPLVGYHAQGAVEEALPLQVELNYIAQKIQRLMTLMTSMIFTKRGSNIKKITNKDLARYEYTDKPPDIVTISAVAADYFLHMDRLLRLIYELLGVSQLAAQAKKPAGLDSGEAIRAYQDVSSSRFRHIEQRRDEYHVDVADLMVYAAARCGNPSVIAHGDHDIEELDFDTVCMERNEYAFRVRPAGLLPEEPAGKIAALQTLGTVFPEQTQFMMELINNDPDVQAFLRRVNGEMLLVQKQLGAIVMDGKYDSPPAFNPEMIRREAMMTLAEARLDDVPNDRIELVERYLEEANVMLLAAAPAPGMEDMPPPPMGGPAGGVVPPQPQPQLGASNGSPTP